MTEDTGRAAGDMGENASNAPGAAGTSPQPPLNTPPQHDLESADAPNEDWGIDPDKPRGPDRL